MIRLTSPGCMTEAIRDGPARYLCVEKHENGAVRPVLRYGRPGFLHLCREVRESK